MSYLSADDFLVGITGGTDDLSIPGVGTIKVRALDYIDVQRINKESAGDEMQAGFLMACSGIVEPKLSADHLAQLQKARPGVIALISKRVSELSGMREDIEKKAGNGS
jgi:hypothetical protein